MNQLILECCVHPWDPKTVCKDKCKISCPLDTFETWRSSLWRRFMFCSRVFCFMRHFSWVDCVRNVMAHAQKPDFVFRRNGRVHLNGQGRQFSRLLASGVCASAVVMLDTPCSEVVWRVLVTHSIRHFPLHFPFHASPCAITFHLDCTAQCFEDSAITISTYFEAADTRMSPEFCSRKQDYAMAQTRTPQCTRK
jgi:hypothetical protein